MNKIKIVLLSIIIIISIPKFIFSQDNANEGTRFLVTFPQNEYDGSDINNSSMKLGIYISSKYDTDITVRNHFNNIVITRFIKANQFLKLDNNELGSRTDIEETSDGKISEKVIEITSVNPIAVNVISSKSKSSDGYLAYPVSEWGKNYIHNSYYHHYSTSFLSRVNRSSGFTIISQTNNSRIKILLKGKNSNSGTTKTGNYRIGDTISITLNANESYTIKTNSSRNNTFDLSGSLIVSTKPIGIISFHERTLLPQEGTDNGRDNLLEMQQPLSNWRNKFVSVDLGRGYGDFFRVLPSKDNTNLTITSYDKNGSLISTENKVINTADGFYEYNNSELRRGTNRDELTGVIGNTIWEADNPILVSQYSYSYSWDNTPSSSSNNNYDPFMMNLINEEQFTKNISFLAPPYDEFNNHNINLIVKVDTTNDIDTQLKSIKFDNQFLYNLYPDLMKNRIGRSEYFWLRYRINSGVHTILSDVKLAAFLYGFGDADSYGMQTALGNLELKDTLLVESKSSDCEKFDFIFNIKSTFASDENGLEAFDFKIVDYKIDFSNNIDYNLNLTDDSLNLELTGSIIESIIPAKFYIQITSETGKVFFDSLNFELKNLIPLNSGRVYNSLPGETINFEVYIDEQKDTLIFLNEYDFSIRYFQDWFEFIDITFENESLIEYVSINNYLDTILLELNYPFNRKDLIGGSKLIVKFRTMLSKDSVMTPQFIFFARYDDKCYKGVKSDSVLSKVCVQNLRLINIIESEFIELEANNLIAIQDVNISVFDYSGIQVIDNMFLEKSTIIELDSFLNSKGLYFIKINNSDFTPPLKYFHF